MILQYQLYSFIHKQIHNSLSYQEYVLQDENFKVNSQSKQNEMNSYFFTTMTSIIVILELTQKIRYI